MSPLKKIIQTYELYGEKNLFWIFMSVLKIKDKWKGNLAWSKTIWLTQETANFLMIHSAVYCEIIGHKIWKPKASAFIKVVESSSSLYASA